MSGEQFKPQYHMTQQEMIKKLNDTLPGFTGSATFTRWNPFQPKCLLTEGAKFVAETAEAYWLMDLIGSYQVEDKVAPHDMQVYDLTVNMSTASGKVVITDGNSKKLAEQSLPFTDFPLAKFTLWAIRNELGGVTVMLPSEY